MQKNLKYIVIALFLVCFLNVLPLQFVKADHNISFEVDSPTISPGDTLKLSIKDNSSEHLTSGQFDIIYDTKRFELLVDEVKIFENHVNIRESTPGRFSMLHFIYNASQAYLGENVAEISFRVKDNTYGKTSFELVEGTIGYGDNLSFLKSFQINNRSVSCIIDNEPQDENQANEETATQDQDSVVQPSETAHIQPVETINSTTKLETTTEANITETEVFSEVDVMTSSQVETDVLSEGEVTTRSKAEREEISIKKTENELLLVFSTIETIKKTTSTIEATATSENTNINELNITQETQAKQEQEFRLTADDSDLQNKMIMGSLALGVLSSLGALGFMIFNNHIKPK